MSFRCQACGNQVKPRISPILVVTETRGRIYPVRFKDPEHPRRSEIIDRGGQGRETVKELKTCGCLSK